MTTPSNEKESVDDGVTAVVDSREPEQTRLLALDHPDIDNWLEEELDAADIVVNGVGFERKTPSDFASSLLEGRLDEQVEKLKQVYDHAYILLSGGFHNFEDLSHTRLNPQSARGKAASITARHGIPVIPCGDSESAELMTERLVIDAAVRLGRKHTEEPTSAHLPTGSVGSDEPSGKRMWACLPNVGPKLAGRIFEQYGGPGDFIREHDDDGINRLAEVEGIGTTTAREVFMGMFNDV